MDKTKGGEKNLLLQLRCVFTPEAMHLPFSSNNAHTQDVVSVSSNPSLVFFYIFSWSLASDKTRARHYFLGDGRKKLIKHGRRHWLIERCIRCVNAPKGLRHIFYPHRLIFDPLAKIKKKKRDKVFLLTLEVMPIRPLINKLNKNTNKGGKEMEAEPPSFYLKLAFSCIALFLLLLSFISSLKTKENNDVCVFAPLSLSLSFSNRFSTSSGKKRNR